MGQSAAGRAAAWDRLWLRGCRAGAAQRGTSGRGELARPPAGSRGAGERIIARGSCGKDFAPNQELALRSETKGLGSPWIP